MKTELDLWTTPLGWAMRQAEAVPILERPGEELNRLSFQAIAEVSGIAQAVTYALNQWQALCRYAEDGRLTMNDDVSQRSLRDQAIGRRDLDVSGKCPSGTHVRRCCAPNCAGVKQHRLKPWAYLHDVILQLFGQRHSRIN